MEGIAERGERHTVIDSGFQIALSLSKSEYIFCGIAFISLEIAKEEKQY